MGGGESWKWVVAVLVVAVDDTNDIVVVASVVEVFIITITVHIGQ
jgi:hypothetical protein